jgi:hypothetical protein
MATRIKMGPRHCGRRPQRDVVIICMMVMMLVILWNMACRLFICQQHFPVPVCQTLSKGPPYASQLSHLRLRHLLVRPVRSFFTQYNNTPNRPNFFELLQYNYILVTSFFRDSVLFGLVRQAEKPKQALKVRQKFVMLV